MTLLDPGEQDGEEAEKQKGRDELEKKGRLQLFEVGQQNKREDHQEDRHQKQAVIDATQCLQKQEKGEKQRMFKPPAGKELVKSEKGQRNKPGALKLEIDNNFSEC